MKRVNTTEVKDDLKTYANRYGLDALGYAILDLVSKDELRISQQTACAVWEYGGNIQD